MALIPATNRQIPEKAMMDLFNRQLYLGNSFCLPINTFELTGTGETNLALITNPATNTGNDRLGLATALFINLRTTASDVGSGDGTSFFRYYINPTISTTSTPTTPVNCRPASANTSIALC